MAAGQALGHRVGRLDVAAEQLGRLGDAFYG
jgi:hypothetical protein